MTDRLKFDASVREILQTERGVDHGSTYDGNEFNLSCARAKPGAAQHIQRLLISLLTTAES